ncbi:MAG: recombinase family protein [Verrucomicrobiota bacterium]|nr:recombinase family protein [Verrucomicrobiota bacterium]
METPLRYFLYLRKSTDEEDRQVLSLPAQEFEVQQIAISQGLIIADTVSESKSARKIGRPEFARMLARIDYGEANAILCWRLNRLARNIEEGGQLITRMQDGRIKELRTCEKSYGVRDVLILAVEFGLASQFSSELSDNVKRGNSAKLRRGEWPGPKPDGYLYNHKLRNIVPDPQKAPIIRKLFEIFATGEYSLTSFGEVIEREGLARKGAKPRGKYSTWWMLTNPLYMGVMVWNKEAFEGKFQPIIDPALFKKVQAVLEHGSAPRHTRKQVCFPFRRTFRCSCGSMITAQLGRGRGGTYRYYRCTRKNGFCGEPYLQEGAVLKQSAAILSAIRYSPEAIAEFERMFAIRVSDGHKKVSSQLKAIGIRKEEVQRKLDKLVAGYIDGSIDEESYHRFKTELVTAKQSLKAEGRDLDRLGHAKWIEPTRQVINTLKTLAFLKPEENLPEIASLVRKVGSNPLISQKTVTFGLTAPYDSIQCLRPVFQPFPQNTSASKMDSTRVNPSWCG